MGGSRAARRAWRHGHDAGRHALFTPAAFEQGSRVVGPTLTGVLFYSTRATYWTPNRLTRPRCSLGPWIWIPQTEQ